MNKILIIITLLTISFSVQSQKYFTRNGEISFTSEAPMEKIEAINTKATCVFDSETGAIEWAVLIKAFEFKKALMQEHFNENYMESSKYPKATFKGKISDVSSVAFSTDGQYEVLVSGTLTIHGVANKINASATFVIEGDQIVATSQITVAVADYKIEIPKIVRENIAKEVKINLSASYEPLNR